MISARKILDWAGRRLAGGDGAGIGAAADPSPPHGPAPSPQAGAEREPAAREGGEAKETPLRETIIEALRTVYDPEIPVNIYDLGLIYDLRVAAGGGVEIDMTLTAPGCPVAGEMPDMVREAVEAVAGVASVKVELVWDPPWDPSRMSEIARLETGMFY